MSSFILDGFVDGFTNGYVATFGDDKIYLNLHKFKNALNKYFFANIARNKSVFCK